MIQAETITITRAEGLIEECFTVSLVGEGLWAKANRVLWQWAETAPKGGGYDKCDFVVTYVDGTTYEGRYDLVHRDDAAPDLSEHIRAGMLLRSGREWPAHFSPEAIESWQRNPRWAADRAAAEQFLDTYAIGE